MIDHRVFYDRLENHCKKCEFFGASRCRKGHAIASPTGCPLQKFPPLSGHGYDVEKEASQPFQPSCASCVVDEKMPALSWPQVTAHFASAMVRWAAAGMPVVSEQVHGERNVTCKGCPRRNGHWCSICRCLIYLKSKVATEQCPEYRWRQ